MRIMSSMGVVLLLLGCTSAPQARSVSVGMSGQQVETVLHSAGAKQVQMDMMDETETDIIRSYDLTDGSVLVVEVSKSNNMVSRLSVCKNPGIPKVKQTWSLVQSVKMTKD